jgi:hypothetical protein
VARLRRRHLDNRLFSFDRDQWLIDNHMVACSDMPAEDFGVLQALTEIGQRKRAHA